MSASVVYSPISKNFSSVYFSYKLSKSKHYHFMVYYMLYLLQALDAWYNIYIFFVLWNESLDSDGQQFHQYQQNEQVNNLKSLHTNKKTRAYAI
jgi:hypothetical protein